MRSDRIGTTFVIAGLDPATQATNPKPSMIDARVEHGHDVALVDWERSETTRLGK